MNEGHVYWRRPLPSCSLGIPTTLQSLRPDEQKSTWQNISARTGLARLSLDPCINASDDAVMSVLAPTLFTGMAGICAEKRAMALKRVAMWASQRNWYAKVMHSTQPALLLEEDALLSATFCEATKQVLVALPREWDVIFLGHCAEHYSSIPRCSRIGTLDGGLPLFLARAAMPHCSHAMLLSPEGASKFHALMADWNETYSRHVIASLRGHLHDKQACAAWKRQHHKQALDSGHDVEFARLILERKLTAFTVWPQLALQPWQLQPGSHLSIDRFIADRSFPPQCERDTARLRTKLNGRLFEYILDEYIERV